MATVKRSVTIDPEVLAELSPERRANLSAAVNDALRLLAAFDAQQRLVDEWEAEQGRPFTPEELAPYIEAAVRAQAELTMMVAEEAVHRYRGEA
ncbi:MAG: hypothetical protein E6I76_04425 [Chloroflexi bacterium]|nr:MAG: hypothetical protein E6I76_04425 [Chloroflexota bacterium]